MKYKYNITHKSDQTGVVTINFKNKSTMIKYLNRNKHKLHDMNQVKINFNQVRLPLNDTVWKPDQVN